MKHVHSCPKCYEHPVCEMDCSIEPDLGTTPDGLPYGHTIECDRCGAPDRAEELVSEFTERLVAEGFDAHRDEPLHAALAELHRLLTDHHERMAKARADLDLATRVLGTTPFDAEVGSRAAAEVVAELVGGNDP